MKCTHQTFTLIRFSSTVNVFRYSFWFKAKLFSFYRFDKRLVDNKDSFETLI